MRVWGGLKLDTAHGLRCTAARAKQPHLALTYIQPLIIVRGDLDNHRTRGKHVRCSLQRMRRGVSEYPSSANHI